MPAGEPVPPGRPVRRPDPDQRQFGQGFRPFARLGEALGIVVDGVLFSAPTIRGIISERAIIMSTFTTPQAVELAQALRVGMPVVSSEGD